MRIAAVLPTYNNGGTVAGVAAEVRRHLDTVIVVNDGSSDNTPSVLAAQPGIAVVTLARNGGKGGALRAGFARAREMGCTHAITLDADGQHLPDDIPLLVQALISEPDALWIGNRILPSSGTPQPLRSRFGAWVGTFWFRFYTGVRIHDTQCGFRGYPLALVEALGCTAQKYDYELEVLIRTAWRKTAIRQIPVHLCYLPAGERISHFRPLRDFLRLCRVNARAALVRIFFPWRFIDAPGGTVREKLLNLVKQDLRVHHDPARAASALALGVGVALLPIHGFQVLTIVALAFALRLSKTLSFAGVTVSSPPLTPIWIMLQFALGRVLFPEPLVRAGAAAARAGGMGGMVDWAVPALTRLGATLHNAGIRGVGEWLSEGGNAAMAATGIVQWVVGSMVSAILAAGVVLGMCIPLFRSLNRSTLNSAGAGGA